MGEIVNQYELLAPFQNKNAGFARWTYGVKAGREYFLKEFLDPIYPDQSSLSETLRMRRIEDCKDFQDSRKKLYQAINQASDGNLVRIEEFFRYDSHYYLAMEKVDACKISMEELQAQPLEARVLLCATIAHAMMRLHEAHIVHSDIKESNVMIKKTATGALVGKVIDFDCSFFEDCQPQSEDELGGDQVYFSPEACQFICGEDVQITCQADVFALGLLFHKYLTGDLPDFDHNEYAYAFDAVLDDQSLELSPKLPAKYRSLLAGMLRKEPDKRYSMKMVYAMLTAVEKKPEPAPVPEPAVPAPSSLHTSFEPHEEESSMGGWFHAAGDL